MTHENIIPFTEKLKIYGAVLNYRLGKILEQNMAGN